MKKLKVVTVVGTRPEIIRLSRVMAKLDESESVEHIAVHTGQNYDYELNQVFYKDLDIRKPDYLLDAAGSSACETIGQILIKVDLLLDKIKPDALLILGDTNSSLCSIAAKKRHIPIFHMEAGNRCYDERVPEETNRKIVDHISDVNLTYSDIAREYLLKEGISADRIIKTGSPMLEVINYYLPQIKKSDVLYRLKLKNNQYFVVSAHREENINNPEKFRYFIKTLNLLASKFKYPVIVSTHPRTRQLVDAERPKINPLVNFSKPLGFFDYNALQLSSSTVLSDSGTISEESSIMGFPALNIREAHERPEAMEEAAVMMVGLNTERIMQGLTCIKNQETEPRSTRRIVADYNVPNVSDKVVRIILSYTDYVKRVVWNE